MCKMVYIFTSNILNWCISKHYWKIAEFMVRWRVAIVNRFYKLTNGDGKLPHR